MLASRTQENKTKVSKHMLGNFFPIAFFKIYYFFMFIVLQILTSVKEITLVTWMLYAWTPKDLMFVLVTPDILEMEATAQVLEVFLLKPFPSERKALSYLRDLFYQHTLYWPFYS